MKLSKLKTLLPNLNTIDFELPNGEMVASHYHLSELGNFTKTFMDCGGKIRIEHTVNFQLWTADDTHHRFTAEKLQGIIRLAEDKISLRDGDIEIEYQGANTIEKYRLAFTGSHFKLMPTTTACLADNQSCVTPEHTETKPKVNLGDLVAKKQNTCTPGGGCC